MKARNIQADILQFLSDGKIHSMSEIASEIEVSRRTVLRHIQALSYRLDIQTFKGGVDRGGVRMIIDKKVTVEKLDDNELHLIIDKLSSMQNATVNIKKFINDLTLMKEIKEKDKNERTNCF